MPKAKFTISRSKVMEQYTKAAGIADDVSYSSKTNQEVAKILEQDTDCFFSVHFETELKHIKDMSRVIFLAQGWSQALIGRLTGKGVKSFIVDNEADLGTLVDFLRHNDERISLFLRLRLKEMTLRTERYFVFGMDSKRVNRRIRELTNNNRIAKLGIHFHRKTQNMAEWNLRYELSNAIDSDVWDMINTVNIGGGLPVEYANTNMDILPGIFRKIAELRDFLHDRKIRLMIEPGRFIAGPAGKLVTYIKGIDARNITVDASVYNSDMDAIVVPVKLKVEAESRKGTPYVIKGCTPCSMDIFRYKVYLANPQVGDKIIFLNAGAYNFASDFCDLQKLRTEIVD